MLLVITHAHHQVIFDYPPRVNDLAYGGESYIGIPPNGTPTTLLGGPLAVQAVSDILRDPSIENIELGELLLNTGVILMTYDHDCKKLFAYSHLVDDDVVSRVELPDDYVMHPTDFDHPEVLTQLQTDIVGFDNNLADPAMVLHDCLLSVLREVDFPADTRVVYCDYKYNRIIPVTLNDDSTIPTA